ncbi:HNH endonuclease family protein [Streptomyces sp. NBC_00201]|uniref:HNH endonuclease family protein n=1 Tax=unclassified Streptomyces TaxID=2593676 RepID=UPI00224E319C|nr:MULTISPECIES: HNH endonuclease family protein [unclassified Streptomyces]MCX5056540.1 HNH endonuclease family protein [Streptomyces sp. NBC_00452]MCX5246539.1 HNH endonuclease family protein [Streptomyces sp. NBC_00201]MCX5287642.1 HNH endonuclease family protein [Streptomyces sp. NBC_00183]
MRRLRGGAATAVVLVFAVAGCKADTKTGSSGPEPTGGGGAGGGAALTAAESLTVKGRAPKTGYARDRFGAAWADTDSNSCDTRDDILKRDLDDVKFTGGTCKVSYGVLESDPYSGKEVTYRRGRSLVDIDHMVALSDAWQKGAKYWDASKRIALANDPLNLLAVDASTNRSKGDGDTATWVPPNKTFRCTYVAAQVAVKKKYGLWVTAAEKAAMEKVLKACPGQKLPSGGNPTKAPARFHAG